MTGRRTVRAALGRLLRGGPAPARPAPPGARRTGPAEAATPPPSGPPGPVLDVEHLSVLDGRTLNVCAVLPEGDEPAAARLLADGAELALEPLRGPDGRWRLSGTARIAPAAEDGGDDRSGTSGAGGIGGSPDPSDAPDRVSSGTGAVRGLPVLRCRPGTTELRAAVTAPDGTVRRYALAPPPPYPQDGPTGPETPHPDGTRISVAVLDGPPGGRAALRIAADPPAAEVAQLHVGWDHVAVRLRVTGAPSSSAGPFRAELALRGGGTPRTLPAAADPPDAADGADAAAVRGFGPPPVLVTVRIRPADLPGLGAGERVWDLRLHHPELRRPLRAGRRATDVRSPKTVHRMPARLLVDGGRGGDDDGGPDGGSGENGGPDGDGATTAVWINPYYTPAGSLALRGGLVAPGEAR